MFAERSAPWRPWLTALALGLAGLLTACGGAGAGSGRPSASGSEATFGPSPPRASAVSGPLAPSRRVTKLLVVVEENHSLSQMKAQMPYTYALARRYGYATDYRAIRHPSLPNYLAISGGSTFGVSDDNPPSSHPIRGASVFGQALARHQTAKLYAQGMPSPCYTSNSGRYAVRHNPWAYYVDERAACHRYDVPFGSFRADVAAGRLPNAGMAVPDTCNDAHDCSLGVADAWFRQLMSTVFAGPDWHSGRLAVVLTADEDAHNQGNRVLTVVIHPSQHHHVVSRTLDHYSLTRLYDEVLGAPRLRGAAGAASMTAAFGLPTG